MLGVEGQRPGRVGRQPHLLAGFDAVVAGADLGAQQRVDAVDTQVDDRAVAQVFGQLHRVSRSL